MKKVYRKPIVQKVDYTFQDQVTAQSYGVNLYADPWDKKVCTWGGSDCSIVFNAPSKARGWNDCSHQGEMPT